MKQGLRIKHRPLSTAGQCKLCLSSFNILSSRQQSVLRSERCASYCTWRASKATLTTLCSQRSRPVSCDAKSNLFTAALNRQMGKPQRNVSDCSKPSVTGFGSAACDQYESPRAGRRATNTHPLLASAAPEQLGQGKTQKGKWKPSGLR